ncbi:MAG: LytTR family DNA-binding domain-containing protein [Litorimonas sp.]
MKPFITPLIAGIVLTVLAPYGTGQFSLFPRFLYWIGLCLAGGTGAVAADKIFSRRNIGEAHWQRALIQSVGATIAVAPFVLFIHTSGELKYVFVSLFYIWVIAIVIAIIAELLQQRMTSSDADIASPPLLERLPPKFREAPLYAISSEDHYVRIHSAAGEHMLLMRLSDAEDLASPIIGLKPHRSWWVAETGVDKVEKSQGKLQIHLKSGTHVPVSREGAKRVRKAGWI